MSEPLINSFADGLGQTRIYEIIEEIKADQRRPGSRRLTNEEMKNKADRQRYYAISARNLDIPIKPEFEYQPYDKEEDEEEDA